jgi:hypothetical protein
VAPQPGQPIDLRTRQAIESKVLVVGLFRPPALFPVTLGSPTLTFGAPSEDAAAPLIFPAMPLYPPQALFDGVVMAELRVGEEGVSSARIIRASPGLEAPTLDVLSGLPFRPARVHGVPTTTMVYAVTAFRQPIIK